VNPSRQSDGKDFPLGHRSRLILYSRGTRLLQRAWALQVRRLQAWTMRTRARTCTRSHTHAHARAHAHAHTHAHTHAHAHAHAYARTHARTHAHTHTHAPLLSLAFAWAHPAARWCCCSCWCCSRGAMRPPSPNGCAHRARTHWRWLGESLPNNKVLVMLLRVQQQGCCGSTGRPALCGVVSCRQAGRLLRPCQRTQLRPCPTRCLPPGAEEAVQGEQPPPPATTQATLYVRCK